MNRRLYLAAYDVADPRRLRHSLELVKGYATGGQKSAYECWLSDGERAALLKEMSLLLEEDQDSFLLIGLDPRSTVLTLGIADEPHDASLFYIQ
ncbi:MAG: CRISPR-associated protein Cas2 [Gammaproteobacteria bacterium RIFOXYA12_FULL_61_12]|nr:MAG: CRISPR-associated protein Cas2 [Gammaproteobacteria bacterium RIFOXYA12_FULL_61_12]OGT88822.1 MAG: CRISPR-associated protein Cas2 [Gammaproteobacteria bacterium RIFOXYD12_FULL_61_37]